MYMFGFDCNDTRVILNECLMRLLASMRLRVLIPSEWSGAGTSLIIRAPNCVCVFLFLFFCCTKAQSQSYLCQCPLWLKRSAK